MIGFIRSLSGYRTYLLAACIGITAALQFLGALEKETAEVLYGLFGSGAFASSVRLPRSWSVS